MRVDSTCECASQFFRRQGAKETEGDKHEEMNCLNGKEVVCPSKRLLFPHVPTKKRQWLVELRESNWLDLLIGRP